VGVFLRYSFVVLGVKEKGRGFVNQTGGVCLWYWFSPLPRGLFTWTFKSI